jgi:aspartate kinase
MEGLVISGIELDGGQARVTVLDVPDRPGQAARIFRRIAESDITVDMIVQDVSVDGSPTLSFTVRRQHLARAAAAAAAIAGDGAVSVEPEIAKLSLLGVGMRTNTGVATRMFGALAGRGIAPAMINTSEVRINVAIDPGRGREAKECLARAFHQRAVPEERGIDSLMKATAWHRSPAGASSRSGAREEREAIPGVRCSQAVPSRW